MQMMLSTSSLEARKRLTKKTMMKSRKKIIEMYTKVKKQLSSRKQKRRKRGELVKARKLPSVTVNGRRSSKSFSVSKV